MPYGGGVRALEHHSREPRGHSTRHIPGVKVVIPSGPRNARALIVAAIRDPDPVVFMEPKRSYRAFREEVPEEEEVLPIGKAQVVQEGTDLTVVTWGAMMRPTLQAVAEVPGARRRSRAHRSADHRAAGRRNHRRSVKKDRPLRGGAGGAAAASASPRRSSRASTTRPCCYLEAPVKRVTATMSCTPYFGRENDVPPAPARIGRAIEETLDF